MYIGRRFVTAHSGEWAVAELVAGGTAADGWSSKITSPPLVSCPPKGGTPGAVTHAQSLGDTYSLDSVGGALSVVMDRSREVRGVDECGACKWLFSNWKVDI